MYLREVVRDESCEVNGRHENVGFRVRGGDFIEIELDPERENSMRPENVPLDVVYEDEYLIVVNKPAGMLVHPTNRDKRGTLLNALAYHLNRSIERLLENAECGMRSGSKAECGVWNAELTPSCDDSSGTGSAYGAGDKLKSAFRIRHPAFIRPGLVHRLDRQTSGLIVIAKSLRMHRSLARQFQRKYVEKKYLALVNGVVREETGTIVAPVGRFAEQKRWDVKAGGKPAETRFRVIERRSDTTLVELEPVTGRTNQLRIHCASIGHPIVGDISRGGQEFSRLCLHAYKLSLYHSAEMRRQVFEIGTPPEFDHLGSW